MEWIAMPGSSGSVPLNAVSMSEGDFARFSRLVEEEAGIKMPPAKKSMLESRLRKRLRALGLSTFREYWDYLGTRRGLVMELVPLIDAVTTNKTDFFREPDHFEYLCQTALGRLSCSLGAGVRRELRVWSAGCSSGKEPYSLAMVLEEHAHSSPGYRYSILGTDISTRMLEVARRGIYREEDVEPVPPNLRRKYLMRSKDRASGLVRVVPALRSRVRFERLNFLDRNYGLSAALDVIFFRNVIIYFSREVQVGILHHICRHLAPGGYLFMGHSETIQGMNLPLVLQSPTVYRKE